MAEKDVDFSNLSSLANNKNPLYALTQDEDISTAKETARGVTVNQQNVQNRMEEAQFVPKLGSDSSTSSNNSPSPPNTCFPADVISQNKPVTGIGNNSKTPGSPQKELAKESPESTLTRQDRSKSQMIRKPSKHEPEDVRDVLRCPRVNCPEKIVICLDISSEMESPIFRSRAGDRFSSLKLLKRAVGIFMKSKQRLDPRHEYALVLLHDTAVWMHDFTSDPWELLQLVEDVMPHSQPNDDTFDLSSIFQVINERITLPCVPDVDNPESLPPPYVVRVIVLYGGSHCVPVFKKTECQQMLQASPFFFVDAFYLHKPPADDNMCEEIFNVLCDFDEDGLSYIFEVSRNPTKLYDCMAQLLAHPLQRPLQRVVDYDIEPPQSEPPPI